MRNIARRLGDEISEEKPLLDSRLPDGSRVAAVFPPCSVERHRPGHPQISQQASTRRMNWSALGTLTPEASGVASDKAVAGPAEHPDLGRHRHRQNDALQRAGRIHSGRRAHRRDRRHLRNPDRKPPTWCAWRRGASSRAFRRSRSGICSKATLRLRPDRIILGEVRGGEAFDLLQALNTGHSGTLSTIHANSAGQAISRFTTCVLMSGDRTALQGHPQQHRGGSESARSYGAPAGKRPGERGLCDPRLSTRYSTAMIWKLSMSADDPNGCRSITSQRISIRTTVWRWSP